MDRVDQQDIVAAFMRGEITGTAILKRIDTPLSHVFLSADRAYKLKRAVRLPFVDFTSLERRRDACRSELAVNRAFAAGLYLDVEPITQRVGGFALGGDGQVVDHVVVMRRFDQALQFDELARAHALSIGTLERTAARVAAFHAVAAARTDAGHVADYRSVISSLRRTESDAAARQGLDPASPALFEALDAELVRVAAQIERRRASGHVRRVHGDLHLRNICMFEGEPTPFDALEFDDRLASIDVIYDLAFLLMDLLKVGLGAHANAVMNSYWDAARESEDALGLIAFFAALRATVRMAVAVAGGDLGEADAYRRLGLDLLATRAPVFIAIGGLSGTGKSAVAKALAPLLPGPAGARLLRTDVLRKQTLALAPTQQASSEAYTPEARRALYPALVAGARRATTHGVSAIVDGTFADPIARQSFDASDGPAPQRFWLTAPVEVRIARVSGRVGDASDADAAVAASQHEPDDLGAAWRRVDADRPLAAIVAEIAEEIGAASRGRLRQ
jgi:hypothetical protein